MAFLGFPLASRHDIRRFARIEEQKPRKGQRKKRKRYNTMVIAVDFDGILCENKFPEIGKPNYEIISIVRQLIDTGNEVILWTSRTGEELTAAVDWCGERGLHFCEVNENAPSNIEKYRYKYPNGTRKVYADIYIDDHNIEFVVDDGMKWLIGYMKEVLNKCQKEN